MATSTALRRIRKVPTGRIVVFLILFAGAFVAVVPFLYMVSHSLKTYGESTTRASAIVFDPEFWPQSLQWENYQRAWREADELRDRIQAAGFRLVDTPQGPRLEPR